MFLRRMCLLLLGVVISAGICGVWIAAQQGPVPVVKGYTDKKSLPIFVEGTELLAEELVSYEGEYIEDTEFGEYVFVTGLLLRNTSDKGIFRARVKLIGEKDVLEFEATYIPPGKAVMVLEKNRKETEETQFYSCIGTAEHDEDDWVDSKELQIQYLSNDLIKITNTTNQTVAGIQLYYKTIYPQGLFYIGGITHCYRINALAAGESITVLPKYFAGNSSQIVYISSGKTRPREIRGMD